LLEDSKRQHKSIIPINYLGFGQGKTRHSTLKHLTMVLQVFLPKQQAVQSVGDCDTVVA